MLDAAGSFERDTGDGLGAIERAVVDRWDAGLGVDEIARQVGRSVARVRDICELYDNCQDQPRVPPALVASNDRFVAALRAAQERGRMKKQLLEVGDIAALLEDRIESLVADLLPNAVKEAHEMCVGSLAGERGQSLRVHIGSGAKRGWWKDFSSSEGGDALSLIAKVLFAGDVKKAVAWAKSWLHLDELDPGRIEQHRLEARARSDARAAQAAAERAKTLNSAKARWLQGRELCRGDPVTRYLAGRGIALDVLADASGGRSPGALRYHEALQYGFPAPGAEAIRLPAMVAMVTSLAGEHVATHRTWLDPVRLTKAGPDLLGYDTRKGGPNDPKKVMGSPLGGHIPLWKGTHRQPLRDIPEGTDVYVSEGIEDGLTAACADPAIRVICMVALGYLEQLELPPQMGRLIILKQNDKPDSAAAKMLARAVAHHRAQGRRVMFVEVPRGCKDLNDLAQAGLEREDGGDDGK